MQQYMRKLVAVERVIQASPLDIQKKTQGGKNSKLKQKTQTQAKNSTFRHFSEKRDFLIAKKLAYIQLPTQIYQ